MLKFSPNVPTLDLASWWRWRVENSVWGDFVQIGFLKVQIVNSLDADIHDPFQD